MPNVRVTVQAIVKPFVAGLHAAQTAASRFGGYLKSAFGGLAGQIAAALSVAGLVRFSQKLIEIGDAIADGSRRIQVSAREYQILGFAARRSGTDITAVETAVKTMQNVLDDAARGTRTAIDSLGLLGLTMQDVEGKTPYERFMLVADALNGVADSGQKSALAVDFFGRSGTALLPMLGDIQALASELEGLNGILSDEAVAAADRASDAFENLKTAMKGAASDSGLLQMLAGAAEQLSEIAKNGPKSREAMDTLLNVWSNSRWLGNPLAMIAKPLLDRRDARDIANAPPSVEVTPEAVDKRRAEAAAEAARQAERKRVREEARRAIEARRAKEASDREAAAAAGKRARLDDYLLGLQDELRIQEMVSAGLERQAAIERELLAARKTAEAAGLVLTEGQLADIEQTAARLWDLRQKAAEPPPEPEAPEPERRPVPPPPVPEFERARSFGANLPSLDTGARDALSVHRASLRRLESIDKRLGLLAVRQPAENVWP